MRPTHLFYQKIKTWSKIIQYSFTILGLIIGLTPATIHAQVDMQGIASDTLGYTVYYPEKGWAAKLAYHQEGFPEHVIVERSLFWNSDSAYISVDVWVSDSDMTLSEWIKTYQSIFVFQFDELQDTTASVEQVKALRYSYQDRIGEIPNFQEVYFKYHDKIVRLSYVELDQGASNTVYQTMIDSFEFTVVSPDIPKLSPEGTSNIGMIKTRGDNDCGGETHCSTCCGASNSLAICCSNIGYHNGNCVWWAWQQACRVWGDALPFAGNARDWADVLGGQHGYTVSSTPAPNTIGCWDYADGRQHVAWVLEVIGSQVRVSDMSCSYWVGVQEHTYSISDFNEGFIYPKGGGTNLCGNLGGRTLTAGTYEVTCDIYVNAGQSLHIKPGVELNYNGHSFTVNGELIWGP
jgi:surface antigen